MNIISAKGCASAATVEVEAKILSLAAPLEWNEEVCMF